jgi:hypothetical protein
LQESLVVLVEFTKIINTVHDHGKALDSKSGGKPRVFFRVNAGHFEYLWVHHAAAQNLQPPATKEYIDFHARFCKGKVATTEADFNVGSKHLPEKVLDSTLQVTKIEHSSLFQGQDFNLMKHERVRGINSVTAIDTSRSDNSQWRLSLAELTNLH